MYQIILHSVARKQLRKFTAKEQEKIISKLKLLVSDPFSTHNNVTKMAELPKGYRLRVGNIRVIYSIETEPQTLEVWKIDWRGSSYKP